MISSLLNNETDLTGVESTKLALVLLQTLSQTMSESPRDGNVIIQKGNTPASGQVSKSPLGIRKRVHSSEDENSHEIGSSTTTTEDHEDDDEDSSSYLTAEEDHQYFGDQTILDEQHCPEEIRLMEASIQSRPRDGDGIDDDTMKTSIIRQSASDSSRVGQTIDEFEKTTTISGLASSRSLNPSQLIISQLTVPEGLRSSISENEISKQYPKDYDHKQSLMSPVLVDQGSTPQSLQDTMQRLRDNLKNLNVSWLQQIFDCFKLDNVSVEDCESLLKILRSVQKREDFQWALHQLGGFNVLLFLYARVVEICEIDEIQARCLSMLLTQMNFQRKLTETPPDTSNKHLIRFLLNSSKSTFGFQTFRVLTGFCLNPKGNRIEDYELLDICLLSSWKRLLSNRSTAHDCPTGERTLFECLLQVILELCSESGPYRDLNIGILKIHTFAESLLSICNGLCTEGTGIGISIGDALQIASCVKLILTELMAPPDGSVAISLIRSGLLPMLPNELPPLPRKSDAFFVYHGANRYPSFNLTNVIEAEEVSEDENLCPYVNIMETDDNDESTPQLAIKDDVPEVVGILANGHRRGVVSSQVNSNQDQLSDLFIQTFQAAILEAVMSILLNSIPILPDDAFRKFIEPNVVVNVFLAYCSHPNNSLKPLAIQLLSAYLSRVKNPIFTDFIKSRGLFLASLYIQGNSELATTVLQLCNEFGPHGYPLLNGLIQSDQVVNTIIQWLQHDEAEVISTILSTGFLPAVLNFYSANQQLSRPLVTLLSLVTKYLVLNPKEEPWRILLCSGIESAPPSHFINSKILQDSIELLRKYAGKELRKPDISTRLLWLLERCICTRMGQQFDKWLLKILSNSVMEMDELEEKDGWKYFVKKNRRRLNYLTGIFFCRIFAPNQGDLEFKQYTVRCLVLSCSNLAKWFPKVIRSDDQIERCFTAFTRVFLSESETRQTTRFGGDPSRIRRPSFHSLISSNGNLVLTLRTAAAVGLPNDLNEPSPQHLPSQSTIQSVTHSQSISDIEVHLSDRVIRSKFEILLVDSGILSPTNNFAGIASSLFSTSPDFKTLRILLEATPISGVSHSELRQCLTTVDKMRLSTISKSSLRRNGFSGSIKIQNNPTTVPFFTISNSATHFESIFEAVHTFSLEVLDIVTRIRTKQEIDVARRISVRDADIEAKEKWWDVRQRLTHPKAPWHFPSSYPKFWALDQSEGPSRVRMRLRKEPLKIHNRFLKDDYRNRVSSSEPINFLFESASSEFFNYPVLQSEIEFIRFCTRIVPGEEYPGEVIMSGDNLYFFCEACHVTLQHCEKITVPRTAIYQIIRRRYTLEDRAAEIFVDSRSFLFVFRTQKDREEFVQVFTIRGSTSGLIGLPPTSMSTKSLLLNSSLTTVTMQWVKGTLSNFDYLMYLNTAAGRTYCDLMQYPVFPFVLSNYNAPTLDLYAPQSYRDLKKPMAIQDPAKEDHFISTYNYLKRECDSTPFHYGSHYSNSGIVLHFLVRLPPYTQHFLKYQDGSFDIPDRSFHSIDTTWKLASKDSNTDFKEAIPEFFYLPEFLQNLQHFDLGVRQNETRVDGVTLPPWAKDSARIFTLVNRQALESQEVRKHLSDWIDLIFGYKQTGKPAIQAINIFHPSTYEGFEIDGDGADDVIQRARRAMIATYGQTPKKLFPFPHSKSQIYRHKSCDQEVIDTVSGIQWGHFIGSPASTEFDTVTSRNYREPVELFESPSRIVFWPERTLILGDSVVGSWDSSGVRIKANIVYLCIGDEITTCVGMDTTLWIGHHSGRITVLKLNLNLDTVIETIELVGHYQPIKGIELNEDFYVAISCSGESYAIVWDMNRVAYANVIEHNDGVDFVYSSRSTGDIVLLNKSKNYVSLKTINGFTIGEIHPEETIESICLTNLDPGRNVNLIAIGFDFGLIKFYSTWDLKYVNQIKVLPVWTLPLHSIRYSRDGRRLYCLSVTDEKYITVALQLSAQQRKSTSSSTSMGFLSM